MRDSDTTPHGKISEKEYDSFPPQETQCRCGCGWDITATFRKKLHEIREAYGSPISINSGARCKARNKLIGGAKRSAHVDGEAADLTYSADLLEFIQTNLERFGIWMEHPAITKESRIHIDIRMRIGGRIFYP